jgi:hypothetical protein
MTENAMFKPLLQNAASPGQSSWTEMHFYACYAYEADANYKVGIMREERKRKDISVGCVRVKSTGEVGQDSQDTKRSPPGG